MPEFEQEAVKRASFSWYEYSPLRIKFPYVRGSYGNYEAALNEFGISSSLGINCRR